MSLLKRFQNADLPPFSPFERVVFWCKKNSGFLSPFYGIGEAFIGRHPGPPRISDLFAIGSKVAEGFVDFVSWSRNGDVFKRNGWHSFWPNPVVSKQIERYGVLKGSVETSPENWEKQVFEVYKIGRYWVALNEELESWASVPIQEIISEIKSLVHTSSDRWFLGWGEAGSLEEDVSTLGVVGERCQDICERLKPYLDRGYPRSIMLTGPPGTGKSILAKQIAMELCGEYLHLDTHLANDPHTWTFVSGWKPRCLIVEDFDHAAMGGDILSQIEKQRSDTELIIFTSNSTEKIRGAMLRPGRTDMIENITVPDGVVLELLTTHIPAEHRDKIQNLYVAYVSEIDRRCEVEGPDNIDEWILEMEERIEDVGDGWRDDEPERNPSFAGDRE